MKLGVKEEQLHKSGSWWCVVGEGLMMAVTRQAM